MTSPRTQSLRVTVVVMIEEHFPGITNRYPRLRMSLDTQRDVQRDHCKSTASPTMPDGAQ
jgi:hypothetical protein